MLVEDADGAPTDDLEAWYRELVELGPAQYEPGERDPCARGDPRRREDARLEGGGEERQNGSRLMALYLLDTNHLGAALDGTSLLRSRIHESLRAGHRFGTCVPVLCELKTGLSHTTRRDQNHRILATLLRQIRVWTLEARIAPFYAGVFHLLRARGRVLSQVDMIVAALARAMDATVLSADRDFEAIPALRVQNWLIDLN